MLKFVNETDYKNIIGCESIPTNFNDLVIDASGYINRVTFGRIKEVTEDVKYATCRIIELMSVNENISNVTSESVEGWSRTYASFEDRTKEIESKKMNILKNCLDMKILYQGVI